MTTDISAIEQLVQQLLTALAPYAASGVLAAACVVAVSRLPLLSIPAMAVCCCFLAAIVASGDSGNKVALALAVAGLVAAGVLLLSGGVLWRRPALPHEAPPREPAPLRRAHPVPDTLYPVPGTRQGLLFRVAAMLVVALAADALAPVLPLPVGPQEARLVLWLAGMGLLAGFAGGSAIISGTGIVVTLSAAALLIPDLVSDPALRPTVFGAVAALMIIAALGFSFADVLRKPGT